MCAIRFREGHDRPFSDDDDERSDRDREDSESFDGEWANALTALRDTRRVLMDGFAEPRPIVHIEALLVLHRGAQQRLDALFDQIRGLNHPW